MAPFEGFGLRRVAAAERVAMEFAKVMKAKAPRKTMAATKAMMPAKGKRKYLVAKLERRRLTGKTPALTAGCYAGESASDREITSHEIPSHEIPSHE